MKRIASIFAVLALFPVVSYASQETDAVNGSLVYLVSGNVFVRQGNNPPHQLVNRESIVSNTLISTGDNSAALLTFADGQIVTMQANSIFQVSEYHYDTSRIKDGRIVFSMSRGGMRFITGLIGQRNKEAFRLSTPNATITIHGTDFMAVMVGKLLYSQVLKGKIDLTNAAGMKVVGARRSAVAVSSGSPVSLVTASAIPAGTFNELLSIPVQPSAIQAPAPEPAPVVPAEPAVAAPIPDTLSGTVASSAATGTAVDATVAATGVAGSTVAGIADSGSVQSQAAAETIPSVVSPEKSAQQPTKAADENVLNTNSRSDVGMTGRIGTLGLGAELDLGLTDSLGARIGINAFTYKYNSTVNSVKYDFNLQMQTISALADWYPFKGSFRTSVGLMYNNNKVGLGGLPTGENYLINGTTYSSAQIGSLQGTMSL